MSIRVSFHVRQRLSERAGVLLSDQAILDLIPAPCLEQMVTGAHVTAKLSRLALDVVCRDRVLTTVLHAHNWRRDPRFVDDHEWRRRKSRRPEPRVCQAAFDLDEEVVVGGRVRRVEQ